MLHVLEITQSLLLLSSGPLFPSLPSAATVPPSAPENPAALSALSLHWRLGSGPALVRTTTSETVHCFSSGLPVFTLPTPSCLLSSYVLCMSCLLASALEQVLREEEEGWAQAAIGCSDLEISAVCSSVRQGKG